MTEYLYRYTSSDYGDEDEIDIRLKLWTYPVVSHTPQGIRIDMFTNKWKDGKYIRITKWVSNTAKKRFAHPTKEEALIGLYWRKKRQIGILNYQKTVALKTLLLIKKEELSIKQNGVKL